jgi:c-di-GMP-binding flagellar brake protein YcgR
MSSQAGKAPKAQAERRQRRHPRYRIEFPVTVILLSEGGHRRIDAHGRDLSTAGIGMLIAAELKLGEVAALNFALPGSQQEWKLRAVLRHRRGYHYGFEFLSIRPEEVSFLAGYLPKLEREDDDFAIETQSAAAPPKPPVT